ncbi:MAG: hypothetical protein GYB68_13090 [Chloroflexi bacterium]|nr:hypothetical protein [Chloroflexota bacterium]
MIAETYIQQDDKVEGRRLLPRLMFEGLLLGGSGLGVLALIFEIAADAFSVAAYQTLLAIYGAEGNHQIAIVAFIILSVMLFLGVVPAYRAAAYLSPNTGGSGPLVESIGPQWLRKASWVGTSLFFLDAVLTIIISSISAADVTLLVIPQAVPYRIIIAEFYAFFIMAVLVYLGPKRAVPLFLLGGGAFTIFTIFALSYVAILAITSPDMGMAATPAIVARLEEAGVIEHIVEAAPATSMAVFFQLLLRSMSSAMLGFSGYEMIPASGKHAARPKWKVINTSLTIAAVFLITTGIFQLFAAQAWAIPATEGYSTLLIQYEIVFGQSALLTIAATLLAVILLLAQGGGYVGGAAVAANASRLGRLPRFFSDDRIGIAVIWLVAAILIPIVRSVVVVESYYAFGFVSAFVITSTTVFFVRDDVLRDGGVDPGTTEAKSLRFAGLRGMVASYIMMIILITQKTEALPPIVIAAGVIMVVQLLVARGGIQRDADREEPYAYERGVGRRVPLRTEPTRLVPVYASGIQRAHDEARQRGIARLVNELIMSGDMIDINVESERIRRLISYTHGIEPEHWGAPDHDNGHNGHHHTHMESAEEPSLELEETYKNAYNQRKGILKTIERYSDYGVFVFIDKFHGAWVTQYRDASVVQRAMIEAIFRDRDPDELWEAYSAFEQLRLPEEIWQFSRERYLWAKDQWPNLSDRITTIWTLQDLGIVDEKDHNQILARIAENGGGRGPYPSPAGGSSSD